MNPHPRYFNREKSWLEFNDRVLDEALDPTNPLLERLKFLAITAANLDEFFMVRVGGLKVLIREENSKPDPAGLSPAEQLEIVSDHVHRMVTDQYECLLQQILPELKQRGLQQCVMSELNERQQATTRQLFDQEIRAVMTPQAVELDDEFPLLANQTICLCVRLQPAEEGEPSRFALLPFGREARRIITIPADGGYSYVTLEDLVAEYVDQFFPGEPVEECVPFRITRNADLGVRDDLVADLLAEMEGILESRKQSECVRLEIAEQTSQQTLDFLTERLSLKEQDVFRVPGPLDLKSFMPLSELPGFDELKNPPWQPQPSVLVDPTRSMFDIIRERDILLHHPYESFEPVVRLLEEAASDPDVLAIKQTLYRTSKNSPIVESLRRAATNGKHVTTVVELKARFDEARNIEWAKNLEQNSVQVIYGIKRHKTHSKICIIVRREPHGIQRYMHFGTGNYNEATARIYTDVSLMTCDEDLGVDAINFFNAICGYSQPQVFRSLEVAPIGLRERLLEMIHTETQRKRQGQRAHIAAKMNSLVDPKIIDALYEASQAGVSIRLLVRGICCLRPGVEGLSENIQVHSIVDRFLEHSRIFYFYHGGDDRIFISSADWMPRNLDRRVELLVPVNDTDSRIVLMNVLESGFNDNVKARILQPDGSYVKLSPPEHAPAHRSQTELCKAATEALRRAERSQRTVFEPHRAS